MNKRNLNRALTQITIRRVALLFAVLLAGIGGWKFAETTQASAPTAGALGDTVGASVAWVGTLPAGSSPNGEPTCTTGDGSAANCDLYTLTVSAGSWAGKRIAVRFNWGLPANDYDMTVRQETNGTAGMQGDGVVNTPPLDAVVGTSGNGTNTFEEVIISPPNAGATYYVRAIYFAVAAGDQYNGTASVESTSTSAPPGSCALPTFDNYQPPIGYPRRDDSGEPSIGVNWNSGNVMTMSRLRANRTTFNDSTSPANPTTGTTWFSQTSPAIVTGLDPIGFTDPVTGRSIFGELNTGFTNAILSDDDLTTVSSSVQFGAASGADHQTIGGGPPTPNVAGRQPTGSYPHLWYYAAQSIATATVATSFDGGLTYQPAIPAYTLAQCNGLHGHIKVAPDGTVYLPNKGCGGKSGFAVSTDNGLNWTVRTVPTSTAGNTDPSVAIGAGGRVYFAYAGGDNRPHVAISNDRGVTWSNDFDLGQSVVPSLTASVFPHAVAGDNNRAAVFFLATSSTNPGDPVGDDASGVFAGTWYPYIATTCDGGQTWSVVRADNDPLLAPGTKNPVQQGVICTNGTTCPAGPPDTRNLLDFNEMAVDSRGRVVAVYADGCNPPHGCMTLTDNAANTIKDNNEGIARLTIIRQRGGMRLFQEFDAGSPSVPLAPFVDVNANAKGGNKLLWGTPDDRGAAILRYRIYRGVRGEREKLLKEVKVGNNAFVDRKTKRGRNYYYHVTAVNAIGESHLIAKTFVSKRS